MTTALPYYLFVQSAFTFNGVSYSVGDYIADSTVVPAVLAGVAGSKYTKRAAPGGSGGTPWGGIAATVVSHLTYRGWWNAAANIPALASGVGTLGDLYIVSVAATSVLDGIGSCAFMDVVVFDGKAWRLIPGDPVSDITPDYEQTANKGQPLGYAGLDENGLLPAAILPFGTDGGTVADGGLLAAVEAVANAALPISGGTITGPLILPGAPTASLHAATKAYVDSVSAANAGAASAAQSTASSAQATANAAMPNTVAALAALIATLPTTLPATSGQLWNDGGVLSIS